MRNQSIHGLQSLLTTELSYAIKQETTNRHHGVMTNKPYAKYSVVCRLKSVNVVEYCRARVSNGPETSTKQRLV